jgi:glutamyl-tRNA reductase
VLDAETVSGSTRDAGRPLFVLDLAVPRDVDPAVGELPGVTLVDLGGLRQTLEERNAPVADLERALAIVDEEVRRFLVRRRSEHLAPLITALRRRGDEVMTRELERYRSQLADLTPDERQAVESLARSIVSKLLHDPIVRLKERSAPGADRSHARLLAELFGVDVPDE